MKGDNCEGTASTGKEQAYHDQGTNKYCSQPIVGLIRVEEPKKVEEPREN